jgi:hypothetical protein
MIHFNYGSQPTSGGLSLGEGGISRFSRMEVPYMPWISDHAGSTDGSRKRRQ